MEIDEAYMKALLTALAVMAAPSIAAAATIAPGDNFSTNFRLTEGGYVSYSFVASEAMNVSQIAVAGTGFSDESLNSVTFGIVGSDVTYDFDLIESGSQPDTFGAIGFINGFTANIGDTFALFFTKESGVNDASMAVSFQTSALEAPAPVPLPAAGGLLALALGGMGVAALRKRR